MKLESLLKNIRKKCKENRKSSGYTNKYIIYAKELKNRNLPIIVSPEHLSMLIGLDYSYMCNMAYAANKFYRHFKITKKNGKNRQIDEPLPDLKYVQHWILINILEKIEISPYAKAYIKNKTLKDNAKFHKKQNIVLTMDIKDFFPSIRIFDVYNIFKGMGYLDNVAWFLANLCCLNKKLPQGAPTSPYLSNIRMIYIDKKIAKYTFHNDIRYTRYADDMTFSGNFKPSALIYKISRLIYANGFQINSKKTRVAFQNTRQEVTGIVVNHHMQIPKLERKHIRQHMYYIKKYGLDSHLKFIEEHRSNYLQHLIGKINFGLFVNPKDNELRGYYDFLKNF